MASRLRGKRSTRPAQTVLLAGLLLAGTALAPMASATPSPVYKNPHASVSARVNDLLKRMSLDDKIGQMVQAERGAATPEQAAAMKLGSILSGGGSVPASNTPTGWADMVDAYEKAALSTPLGIPTIYGVDAVHGHNNVYGATIFPHNIGLGAAGDPQLVERIGRATAEEVASTGPQWDFSPCLCVARDDRWGRTYESFGESPRNAVENSSVITGLQGNELGAKKGSVLATAKHYIGDGGTTAGVDQGNTQISEQELRKTHLPPFKEAIKRGVGSVMISFSSFQGVRMHAQQYLITDVLKKELGFSGLVISDYNAINQIDGQDGFTHEEVRASVNAGIDMFMVPWDAPQFITFLHDEVAAGTVKMSRIDDANKRILGEKFKLGLFEHPYADRSLQKTFGSKDHRDLARQAVRESQVLLKNDGVLPLDKKNDKIFVAGKNANDMGNQSGGWTLTWQGQSGPVIPGTTILDGIKSKAGKGSTVTYDRAGDGIDPSYEVAVAVVGETPYAEGQGDRPSGFGLDAEDLATIAKLKATGVPLVVLTVSGRPLVLTDQLPQINALVASWLPGSEGAGVADVLFGDYNPTGKLSVSWPASAAQEPVNVGDGKKPLYPYGYGLKYERGGHH
ncbi:glycoside hydrolase family 3 protein [Amycolatopsis sp. H20-H5]|uniref:glycoside hydrolase family 3 protein n=1 Tax=Amycolatopsis sp. H20-H5 TaxID=3046309 RepID=UPI002DB934E7|nr:glycoside hydrolase family 3 N-terminal domain-containing protein [Amycolatopsis sp. H20-H5]MEC3978120.1 glycoside hydrolase family 3 N-terminal domain-containing protein [Amycolatopsis sp. H20-H5]